MAKISYRVKNWREYNQALKNRGSITLWVDAESTNAWYSNGSGGKIGAPYFYGDAAIICALTLRAVFSLPLRQTEGFMESLLDLMNLDLDVPNYSTLSRRASSLDIELPGKGAAAHIVVDSTGLKVYGDGEWKARQHGVSKRRTWRKLHLAVDASSHQVIAGSLTTNDYHDSEIFDDLVGEEYGVEAIYADGAYDTKDCFETAGSVGAKALIPPRRGAKIKQHGNSDTCPLQRDENIRGIRKLGRKGWKKDCGYHLRSLAETAMSRFKSIFGGKISSRIFGTQATEAFIKLKAMNKMTTLGMPKSVPVV